MIGRVRATTIMCLALFASSCAPMEAAKFERMSQDERQQLLSSMTNQQLCNGHNNAYAGPQLLASVKRILKSRSIKVCTTDNHALGATFGLTKIVYSEDQSSGTSTSDSSSEPNKPTAADLDRIGSISAKDLCVGVQTGKPDYVREAKRRKLADSACEFGLGFEQERNAKVTTEYGSIRFTASRTNLRAGPRTNEKIITVLETGTRLNVASANGDWHPVQMNDGTTGYVFSDLLLSEKAFNKRSREKQARFARNAVAAPTESGRITQPNPKNESSTTPTPAEAAPPSMALISPSWRPGGNDVLGVSETGTVNLIGKISGAVDSFTIDGSQVTLNSGGFFRMELIVAEGQVLTFELLYGSGEKKVGYALTVKPL